MGELRIFKELSVGGVSKDALIERLHEGGIRLNDYARTLLGHASFSPRHPHETARLIKASLSDLDLSNPCSLEDLIDRAAHIGLGLCPPHLAAFLRLEYLEQPEGPYLTIVSPRPERDETYPTGFYLRHFDGSLWLRGYRAVGDSEWPAGNEFIFRG